MKGFNVRIMFVIIALLLIPFVLFSFGRNKTKISDDPLSTGIVERWGAALPAGFTKESVEKITDGKGCNFAKLTFEKEISGLLTQWKAPDDEMKKAFDELIGDILANTALSKEEQEFIRANCPEPDEGYLAFSLTDEENPGAKMILCYQPETKTMFVAEEQK